MGTEKETTAPIPPVAPDGEQPFALTRNDSIPFTEEKDKSFDGMPVVSMPKLMEIQFPVKPTVIEGLLPVGTYLLAGAPKVGKSFFVLQMAYQVSTGGTFLGCPVHPGTVLYLALEDTLDRLQKRLVQMTEQDSSDLILSVLADTLDENLLAQLEGFLMDYPDTVLVIIDTLQRVRGRTPDSCSYYWKQNIDGNGGKNIRMEYKDNGDGTYTIIDMPYADVTISISKMAKAIDPDAVEVSTYVELDNKTVFKVVVQGSHELLNRDQTTYSYTWFTYDGQKMYCNPRYTKFAGNGSSSSVYLVMVDKGETLTKEDAMAKLSIVTSTEQENKDQTLKVGSDVNEDGIGGVGINRRDVNDVQLIYDLYNGLYDSFETVSMRKFLKADVNCDGVLDSQDAVKLAGELFL